MHQSPFKGINVVSIPVTNFDRARDFYRDVLGLGEPLQISAEGWLG